MAEPPASPRLDQIEGRLRDLRRLKELIRLYAPGGTDIRDEMHRMPAADRTETRAIFLRLGRIDTERAAQEEEMRHLVARLEMAVQDWQDRYQAEPETVQAAQDLLAALDHFRNQIAGLEPDDGDT